MRGKSRCQFFVGLCHRWSELFSYVLVRQVSFPKSDQASCNRLEPAGDVTLAVNVTVISSPKLQFEYRHVEGRLWIQIHELSFKPVHM